MNGMMRKVLRRGHVTVASKVLRTRSGYVVGTARGAETETLTLTAPDGRVCLQVRLLPEGPVLEVQGGALRLVSEGELYLGCERLTIEAQQEMTVRAGRLDQEVAGDARFQVGGRVEAEGHALRLHARRGDLALSANDDVSVDGERVLLNSPKEPPPSQG